VCEKRQSDSRNGPLKDGVDSVRGKRRAGSGESEGERGGNVTKRCTKERGVEGKKLQAGVRRAIKQTTREGKKRYENISQGEGKTDFDKGGKSAGKKTTLAEDENSISELERGRKGRHS